MKRPTIADIARGPGVSKGAVSYALNGQPGVSEATRAAHPRHRRARSASAQQRRPRPVRRHRQRRRAGPVPAGPDPRHRAVLHGADQRRRGRALRPVVRADPAGGGRPRRAEIAVYRRWWGERRVDGVLVCDLRDERPAGPRAGELRPARRGDRRARRTPASWPASGPTTRRAIAEAVEYLAALGHRRIARVGGLPELLHTEIRTDAFTAVVPAARPDRGGHRRRGLHRRGRGAGHPRLLSSARPARPRRSTTTT